MNKYIQKARNLASAGTKGGGRLDPVLAANRPALEAFMCDAEEKDGAGRELSVLMIVAEPDGMRVGLRDEDCGGWLWRSADTLKAALDAIEKALQDGTARFGGSPGRNGRKGKR